MNSEEVRYTAARAVTDRVLSAAAWAARGVTGREHFGFAIYFPQENAAAVGGVAKLSSMQSSDAVPRPINLCRVICWVSRQAEGRNVRRTLEPYRYPIGSM